jgi:enoyl-CoA hydratase/carnithine racemase
MTNLIREELADGVLLITLNRPDRLNALTFEMFNEFHELCNAIHEDRRTSVVIVTGAGRGFCAGLDLDCAEQLARMSPREMMIGQEQWARGITAFRRLPQPVIAAVNGPAAGAGFGLALAADVRVLSTAASFVPAFVRIGLSGGDVGVSWLLPRIVGLGQASEILLTGRSVDPADALRIGLANAVVAPDAVLDRAKAIAGGIAEHTTLGVRLTKQVLQASMESPSMQAALEIENRQQVLATRGRDFREALEAFRQKRTPKFTGE